MHLAQAAMKRLLRSSLAKQDSAELEAGFRFSPKRPNIQLGGLATACELHLERNEVDDAVRVANEIQILASSRRLKHGPLVQSLRRAAKAYERNDDLPEAIAIRRWICALEQSHHRDDSFEVNAARESLAHDLSLTGDLEEALDIQGRVAAWYARSDGPTGSRTTAAETNLGIMLLKHGRTEEAKALLERLLATVDPSEAELRYTNLWLAQILKDEHDYDAEVPLRRTALKLSTINYGAEDPRTHNDADHLAMALWNSGNQQEAQALAGELLASRERLLGDDDPTTKRALKMVEFFRNVE